MIAIEGATLSALGAGLNHYLKQACKVEMTWSGDRFDQLPAVPPLIPAEAGVDGIVRASFVPWRYYMNVVTFGYSFAFWDWKRWQRELGMRAPCEQSRHRKVFVCFRNNIILSN